MLSFSNFPTTITNPNFKLTPRSAESLLRTGLQEQDLLPKTEAEVLQKYGGSSNDRPIL
jgi:hypothetical protein